MKNNRQLTDEITDLCEQAGCSDKIAKIHLRQYVHGSWNPHPAREFLSWWNKGGPKLIEAATGSYWRSIDAVRAFNCDEVRKVYRESK